MPQNKISLSPEQKENILRDMWVMHNARWFLKSVAEFGHQKATEMNQKVIKSFATYEIQRLLKELKYPKIDTIEDLKVIIDLMGDLAYPEDQKPKSKIIDRSSFVTHIDGCFIHKNVCKS